MIEEMNAQETAGETCDVFVIGGGPGGSTIATLLADRGWRVVLCDKDRHPRFHIGESLLPMNLPIFETLGVLDQVQAIGMRKNGVDLTSPTHVNRTQVSYFDDALRKDHTHAFHVRRAEFDHLLLKNSAARGVDVREETTVDAVAFQRAGPHRVTATDEQGHQKVWDADFVVDASGRDTFLARKLGHKRRNRKHQSAAIFGHFENVTRRDGRDEGNIGIYWFEHGWFWMIPLRDGAMSVGAVCWPEYLKTRRVDLDHFLWDTIRLCPDVAARMRDATLVGEAQGTGNYSYRATRMYGDGYILVGDAYAFVDPIFSSGVYLAMQSALLGADAVDARLRSSPAAARLMRRFDRQMRRGLNDFSWFIYRFTTPTMHELLMTPRNPLGIRNAIVSVFAGDLFDDTPIRLRITLFKLVYLLTSAMDLTRSMASYSFRRRNAQVPYAGGDTAPDAP